jgi:chaperonin GroEL (HSP60 family)
MAHLISRYFTFLVECKNPKACTILLRGPSKDILNEIDRNLADVMSVARNVVFNPILVPGAFFISTFASYCPVPVPFPYPFFS